MIPGRKFSKIYKRGIMLKPCQKISVVESVFNKITGIDFTPSTEEKFPPRRFSFGYIEMSAPPHSGLTWTFALVKLRVLHCRVPNYFKSCYNINFLKILFLRDSFRNIFRKKPVAKSAYRRFLVYMLSVCNFIKINSSEINHFS